MREFVYTGRLTKDQVKLLKENFPQVRIEGTFHGVTTILIPEDDITKVTNWCKSDTINIKIKANEPL